MKQTICILAVLMILSTELFSQDNQCNCLENLNKIVAKTEENYTGFPAKINEVNNTRYKELIKALQKKSLNETNPKTCFYLLKEYIRFFKDKHFILNYSNANDYDNEKITYSEKYFKKELAKKGLSEIEGVWVNE